MVGWTALLGRVSSSKLLCLPAMCLIHACPNMFGALTEFPARRRDSHSKHKTRFRCLPKLDQFSDLSDLFSVYLVSGQSNPVERCLLKRHEAPLHLEKSKTLEKLRYFSEKVRFSCTRTVLLRAKIRGPKRSKFTLKMGAFFVKRLQPQGATNCR